MTKPMQNDGKKHKSAWFYIAVIICAFLVFLLVATVLGRYYGSSTNVQRGFDTSYNSQSAIGKGVYTYTFTGSGDISTLHRPNDIVTIRLVGSNNVITVTPETEVSKIILTGTNNEINFCRGGYPIPEFNKVGENNQINLVNC